MTTDETPPPQRWLPPVATPPEPAPPPAEPPAVPPAVPLWAPFAALLAVYLVTNVIGAALIGAAMAADPSIENVDNLPFGVTLGLMALQGAVFILGAVITVRLVFGHVARERLGLRPVTSVKTAAIWAAGIYIAFWIVVVALYALFGEADDQGLVDDVRAQDSVLTLIVAGFMLGVVAPVAEELFFRGLMLNALLPRLGVVWASLIVGGVFALGHAPDAPLQSVVALGAFGVGLCVLYWRAQSIIPCMALHALFNSITFGAVASLQPALFVGVVVLCVGAVTAGAVAVSARPRVAG